jgi:hypothetical protein
MVCPDIFCLSICPAAAFVVAFRCLVFSSLDNEKDAQQST